MTTKFNVGDVIDFKIRGKISSFRGDSTGIAYKIAIPKSNTYLYLKEEDLTDVVKVKKEVSGTIDTDPLYFARGKESYAD